jgi:hypothetical protein
MTTALKQEVNALKQDIDALRYTALQEEIAALKQTIKGLEFEAQLSMVMQQTLLDHNTELNKQNTYLALEVSRLKTETK